MTTAQTADPSTVQHELAEAQVERGLRISVVEGLFATGHLALTGGMFLVGLALLLGATPFQIGLLAAVPCAATVFSLLSSPLVRRLGARRGLVVWTSGIGRAVFLVLVPLLLFRAGVGIGTLLAVVVGYNVLLAIANTSWNSWMSDLVPERRRGRFFGMRNAVLGAVAMALTYAGGRALDWFKTFDQEAGYGVAIGVGVLCGLGSTVLLSRQPEPRLVPRPKVAFRERVIGPLQEPQFRRLTVFMAVWFVTGTLASPFYLAHLIKNIEFPYTLVGVYAVFGGTTGILFQFAWGWVIDRFGPKPVTVVCFALVGIMPLLWLLATSTFRLPIWIDGVLNGVAWTGANLGLLNMVLGIGDNPVRKESYFAIFAMVVGLATFVASMVGGGVAQLLAGMHLRVLGREFVNYHVLFLVTGVLRFACLPLLVRVEERRSRKVVKTIRILGTFALSRLNYGKGIFLQALRARSRG
ncbi:MAG: MFS transporter [candidate division WOR-3 bacterium]|nr:MAG: MFS transporter [candidate division WOR-3 bacterium]